MCGIAGWLSYDSAPDLDLVKRMTAGLSHRGPDSDGIYAEGPVVLGHRRLSIIDTSERANQPFHLKDGRYHLVFNGEIYNYQEVKSELKTEGETQSDTEVVLLAYKEWGVKCVERFNGMFAFAIWDSEKQELFIARDRIGIKPLYLLKKEGVLLFSSEIRPLIHSGHSSKKTNAKLLSEYLGHQTIYAPATIVQDIEMLMPGHWMKISNERIEEEAYWSLDESRPSRDVELKEIKGTLQKAVSYRMISDVPLGAFLSGGIDSSAIVGLMAEQSELPVETFSVTFGEKKYSEKEYSDLVAAKFKTKHTEIHLESKDFLQEIPEVLKSFDHPSGDGPNSYIISKAVKSKGLKVALSGLGGDELFAGYDLFQNLPKIKSKSWWFSLPQSVRTLISTGLPTRSVQSKKLQSMLKSTGELDELHDLYRSVWLPSMSQRIIDFPKKKKSSKRINPGDSNLLLSQISSLEMSTYMSNVLLRDTDQMSMAHALEIRVPFLDHNLVELTLSISDKQKWPSTPKQLLVKALGDLLPDEIVNRKKMGFVFPWAEWMKNDLNEFCEEGIQYLLEKTQMNAQELERVWREFKLGSTEYRWSRLWPLVVLGYWMKQHGIEEA